MFDDVDLDFNQMGEYVIVRTNTNLSHATSSISIEMPNDVVIFVERNAYYLSGDNEFEWEGVIASANYAGGKVSFINTNDGISGLVNLNNYLFYRIMPLGDGYSVIYKSNHSMVNDCDSYDLPQEKLTNTGDLDGRIGSTCNGLSFYRLVIAYTPGFRSHFNSDEKVHDYFEQVVDAINDTYIQSNLQVRARLVLTYKTSDNGTGDKDEDYNHFVKDNTAGFNDRFDEIFEMVFDHNSDVGLLFAEDNYGGRAHRNRKLAVVGAGTSSPGYGGNIAAHEIGHMFDLEHNREEFGWWKKKVNGLEWALDEKKAYGYRGTNNKSIMSYGNQTRIRIYSDPNFTFPDGESAGDNYAKARDFINGHISNVITHADTKIIALNNYTVSADRRVQLFARNEIISNTSISYPFSRLLLQAQEQITLKPDTHYRNGSEVKVKILNCAESSSVNRISGFNTKDEEILVLADPAIHSIIKMEPKELEIYPNPFESELKFKLSSSSDEIIRLMIYNSLGQIMMGKTFKGSHGRIELDIKLPELKSGVYYYKVISKDKIYSGSVLKD